MAVQLQIWGQTKVCKDVFKDLEVRSYSTDFLLDPYQPIKSLRASSAGNFRNYRLEKSKINLESIRTLSASFTGLDLSTREASPVTSIKAMTGPSMPNISTIVEDLMSKMDRWEVFDVTKLKQATKGKPLFAVVKAVLKDLGLTSALDPVKLDSFLRDLEASYKPNVYHSSTHAADVAHGLYMMIKKDGLAGKLTFCELLALVLAAAGHDVGHRGLTNKFLVDTKDEIALQYGTNSPNEQLHAATTVSLIRQHELLPPHLLERVSTIIKQVILSTDMVVHPTLLEKFEQYVKLYGADLGTWTDAEARMCATSVMLHMADIANIAKPCSLAKLWANFVTQEAHQQGDLERANGMQVAPLFDRAQTDVPGSQRNFIAHFKLREAFVSLAAVAPAFGQMALQHLDANVTFYNTLVKEGVKTL